MTQVPFDQLSKQYLEEFLEPLETVQRNLEVLGESKFVDVWFVPTTPLSSWAKDLGLLGQIIQSPCLLEPFRNAPSRTEIRTCVLKLIWIQEEQRRKGKQQTQSLQENNLPQLWILAAIASNPVIQDFGRQEQSQWGAGVYVLPKAFRTAIIAINKLPETPETLWLRVLGRGATQKKAIAEVFALPEAHPRRAGILRLLASWKVSIEVKEILDAQDREELMALSQVFLDWEQKTIDQAQKQEAESLVLRQLTRRLGQVMPETETEIRALSLPQLEDLGEALLDFSQPSDLDLWLRSQSVSARESQS
jgi:uncharacterized protein YjeT (DUF2065 family)